MVEKIYNNKTFWPAFIRDFENAIGHVIIQSPFMSPPRIQALVPHLRKLIRRGVAICVFVQKPQKYKDSKREPDPSPFSEPTTFDDLCELLESIGVHVTQVSRIHGKNVVIDFKISWEGSMNVLSHTNAKEHMRRSTDSDEVYEIVRQQELKKCAKCLVNRRKFSFGNASESRLKQVANLLIQNRKLQRVSQRKLAKLTGVSHQRIGEIESGSNLKIETMLTYGDHIKVETLLVPEHYVAAVCNLMVGDNPRN